MSDYSAAFQIQQFHALIYSAPHVALVLTDWLREFDHPPELVIDPNAELGRTKLEEILIGICSVHRLCNL